MTAPARALAFFDEARAAFRGERVAHYRIAGQTVRVASSDGFDFVHRAFAHLHAQAKANDVELDIRIWEKSAMPSPPWGTEDYGVRGEIRGFNDGRFQTAFDHVGNSLSMLDRERNLAIFWTREAAALPQSEHGAPLKSILHWWLESRGDLFVHGAAVGHEKGAILLAGEGGAGKSTTAVLCAKSGLNYLGDDYCAVALPNVFSLYGTAKTARGDFGEAKDLLYLNEAPEMKMTAQLPLRAILVPQIDPLAAETSITPTTGSAAFKALAPSTISQLSGAGAQTFQRLAQLVREIPCFKISLARDFDHIAQVVRRFLENDS